MIKMFITHSNLTIYNGVPHHSTVNISIVNLKICYMIVKKKRKKKRKKKEKIAYQGKSHSHNSSLILSTEPITKVSRKYKVI